MSRSLLQQVEARLAAAKPTEYGLALAEICTASERNGVIQIGIQQGVYCQSVTEVLSRAVAAAMAGIPEENLLIAVDVLVKHAKSLQSSALNAVPGVKNIVAIASGKGGVGKSTTAVNIALALARDGAKVGILDADIYGPSQPHMLGVGDQRPEMYGQNMIEPIAAHGVKVVSMGNLVTENTPMVWRGPMVSGALQQLLQNTHWADIDYLIVDMPPGTGDIQLTLSQTVPVSGSVIVTTPQDIALLDARKGIEMFRKVQIPVFGVVENMSTHICSQCGHVEPIFGEQGGALLAQEYGVDVLGRLPLALSIRAQTDSGKPPVVAEPDSEISREYQKIARKLALTLWQQALAGTAGPQISVSDD